MNRIILIGNGFDLAHGLKTSYNNFIDDYWSKTIESMKQVENGHAFENEDIKIENIPASFIKENNFFQLEKAFEKFRTKIQFKNKFLEEITRKTYLLNWVDIENEYYYFLKKSFEVSRIVTSSKYDINALNQDFKRIKELLKEYLIEVEKKFDNQYGQNVLRIKQAIGNKIYSSLKLKEFSEFFLNQRINSEFENLKNDISLLKEKKISIESLNKHKREIINRIGLDDSFNQIKKLLLQDYANSFFDLIPNQTLFLNFNYTYTEQIYRDSRNFDTYADFKFTVPKFIHIHGTTDKNDNNPIIFGFGDEIDEDYRIIEKLNDNKYLENIKSINYLETNNYKALLDFVNSEEYQIYILGHSCGVSDRTLLNTLFEHDNCASIKVFYHQKTENEDNFSDIVRNISRNFNDKAKMRDRVVNKTYCEPLS